MTGLRLQARTLEKRFGDIIAVDGISFDIKAGEVLGFLGPNGAGKSTTMKMLTGFLRPSAGTAAICGHDVQSDPEAAKARLGYLPEGAPAYADMTARQLLGFVAGARRVPDASAAMDQAADALGLARVLDKPIDTLSKGFRRRVGLAAAILHDPDVLILDEPTDGLDPNQKHEVRRLIQAMAADKAIIVSTHILEEVEAVCTRAMVIDKGRTVFDGTPTSLRALDTAPPVLHLFVADSDSAMVLEKVQALDAVVSAEPQSAPDGSHWIAVTGTTGRGLMAEVGTLARAEGMPEIGVQAVARPLDGVFRTLTTVETEAA